MLQWNALNHWVGFTKHNSKKLQFRKNRQNSLKYITTRPYKPPQAQRRTTNHLYFHGQCGWPALDPSAADPSVNDSGMPLHAMVLADTHLLGRRNGHWLDKLRRYLLYGVHLLPCSAWKLMSFQDLWVNGQEFYIYSSGSLLWHLIKLFL